MQKILLLLALISFLGGCATPGVGVLPIDEEMTTTQIYNQVINDNRLTNTDKFYRNNVVIDSKYSNRIKNKLSKINKEFRTLPNPQIPMYIFAHRVEAGGEMIPVSGYTTAFHLYKQNHFALPGEAY